jgi:hypothetical protein
MTPFTSAKEVCEDCLVPLARELISIANRFQRPLDNGKIEPLIREQYDLREEAGFDESNQTPKVKRRLITINKQLSTVKMPGCARNIENAILQYRLKEGVGWVKVNLSAEYGNEILNATVGVLTQLQNLEFKANQLLAGKPEAAEISPVPFALQMLISQHYAHLRDLYAERDEAPERDDLPKTLKQFEITFIDEYSKLESSVRDIGRDILSRVDEIRMKFEVEDRKYETILASAQSKQRTRGRKNASLEVRERELGLFESWNLNCEDRADGLSKKEFSAQLGINFHEFDRLLKRVRKRKKDAKKRGY